MFNASLAGSEKQYVVGQAYARDDESLHIQISGPAGNRGYGLALSVPAEEEVLNWFRAQDATLPSLAASSARYVPVQFNVQDEVVHAQATGVEGNRPYGLSFELEAQELAEYVQAILE